MTGSSLSLSNIFTKDNSRNNPTPTPDATVPPQIVATPVPTIQNPTDNTQDPVTQPDNGNDNPSDELAILTNIEALKNNKITKKAVVGESLNINFKGTGDGNISVFTAINNEVCDFEKQIVLTDKNYSARLKIPDLTKDFVKKIEIFSETAELSLKISKVQTRNFRNKKFISKEDLLNKSCKLLEKYLKIK